MGSQTTDSVIEAGCLLLVSVADADDKQDALEFTVISDILMDYFELDESTAQSYIERARQEFAQSTGLFEYGEILNNALELADKIEFLRCVYEVGYADGELHYLEAHVIQKIANILNVEHHDLVAARIDVQNWLEE